MHWKDIEFKLANKSGAYVVLKSDQHCGNILSLDKTGVELIWGIGGENGFDLDKEGRIKAFRGATASSRLSYDREKVSESELNGVTFKLWFDRDAEQLVITAHGYNLLLIDKTGLYRFSNVSGDAIGLPVDDQGRLMILKA